MHAACATLQVETKYCFYLNIMQSCKTTEEWQRAAGIRAWWAARRKPHVLRVSTCLCLSGLDFPVSTPASEIRFWSLSRESFPNVPWCHLDFDFQYDSSFWHSLMVDPLLPWREVLTHPQLQVWAPSSCGTGEERLAFFASQVSPLWC